MSGLAAAFLLLAATAEAGAGSAAPQGVFDCKITVGENEGQSVKLSNGPDGMKVINGGGFVGSTENLKPRPVHRVVDGLVVDGALIAAKGDAGRYSFSLDRLVGSKEGPVTRVWIMKISDASQPTWTGQNYVVAEISSFAAVGRCSEAQGNLIK
jgi:hypothetical protein